MSGVPITKAGPNLVKKFAFLSAEVARIWDPQIAQIYWDQMVNKGKHHAQKRLCTRYRSPGPPAGCPPRGSSLPVERL